MVKQINNERRGEYMKTALQIIIKHGGSYPSRLIIAEMEKILQLTEYEKFIYEKTGYIRWESIVHFMSIGMGKAGWIRKHKGSWYVTKEAEKIVALDNEKLYSIAEEKFEEWKSKQDSSIDTFDNSQDYKVSENLIVNNLEEAESKAREAIREKIKSMGPYDFQDLVAALFRGMGYYTPFIAPKGRDGGIDIIAYKDPIGATHPRIRIQVKHTPDSKVSRKIVAELNSDLQVEGYIGVIVSTGGFSADALTEIRKVTNKHIEDIDLERFMDLWEEHYDSFVDEDKNRLSLNKVYFLSQEK